MSTGLPTSATGRSTRSGLRRATWRGPPTSRRDYSPHHAGLGRFVSRRKGDFIGREALERIAADGPHETLCLFTLEQPADVFGGEAILRDGAVLGVASSANFGHTVGKPIAMGYVPAAEAGHRDYEIEAFSRAVPAVRHDKPPYDPKGTRQLA